MRLSPGPSMPTSSSDAGPHCHTLRTLALTLNLDISKPLRSLPRLEGLVRAVRDAPLSTQEQPFIEWKREGDVFDKKWRAELAKQVLGMANRDPDAAAGWLGDVRTS